MADPLFDTDSPEYDRPETGVWLLKEIRDVWADDPTRWPGALYAQETAEGLTITCAHCGTTQFAEVHGVIYGSDADFCQHCGRAFYRAPDDYDEGNDDGER